MPGLFPPPGLSPPSPPNSYEIALSGQKPSAADVPPSPPPYRQSKAFSPLTLPRHPAQFTKALETVDEEAISESESDSDHSGNTDSEEPNTPSTSTYSVSHPTTPSSSTFPRASLHTRVDTLEINFEHLMKRVDGLRRKLTDMRLDVGGMEDTLEGLEKKKKRPASE
ncbi:hypothetical protein MIND_00282500 [Mycena indigotica]|uniref:Uncharacterized protein n=1 Tax=Mycena indigotica TaxID=2126181 RepID=A0A8H6T863_9AGAR|nr:uncharacterized protein MIND_00282500 [Mycena indigotica]KAF7312681.1 hypothetical protein MIND_00282500 [Mycena indigotica]